MSISASIRDLPTCCEKSMILKGTYLEIDQFNALRGPIDTDTLPFALISQVHCNPCGETKRLQWQKNYYTKAQITGIIKELTNHRQWLELSEAEKNRCVQSVKRECKKCRENLSRVTNQVHFNRQTLVIEVKCPDGHQPATALDIEDLSKAHKKILSEKPDHSSCMEHNSPWTPHSLRSSLTIETNELSTFEVHSHCQKGPSFCSTNAPLKKELLSSEQQIALEQLMKRISFWSDPKNRKLFAESSICDRCWWRFDTHDFQLKIRMPALNTAYLIMRCIGPCRHAYSTELSESFTSVYENPVPTDPLLDPEELNPLQDMFE